MREMRAVETLATRGGVDQLAPRPAPGGLVAAPGYIAHWDGPFSQYGHDQCFLRPGWLEGERVWLLTRDWVPGPGYCAEGVQQDVISYEEGLRLLEENNNGWAPEDTPERRRLFPDFDFERRKALEAGDLDRVFWRRVLEPGDSCPVCGEVAGEEGPVCSRCLDDGRAALAGLQGRDPYWAAVAVTGWFSELSGNTGMVMVVRQEKGGTFAVSALPPEQAQRLEPAAEASQVVVISKEGIALIPDPENCDLIGIIAGRKWLVEPFGELPEPWKGRLYWTYPLARIVGGEDEDEFVIVLSVPNPEGPWAGSAVSLEVEHAGGRPCYRPGPLRVLERALEGKDPFVGDMIRRALLERVEELRVHAPALLATLVG